MNEATHSHFSGTRVQKTKTKKRASMATLSLRRIILPLIKRVHPDALAHLSAPASTSAANAASLKTLNAVVDACQAAADGVSGAPSLAKSYPLTFYVQQASRDCDDKGAGEGGRLSSVSVLLKRCEAELHFPPQLMRSGTGAAIRSHAEKQLLSLLTACGLRAEEEVAQAKVQMDEFTRETRGGKFAKSADELRRDRMSREDYHKFMAEAIQKHTSGYGAPTSHEDEALSATRRVESFLRGGHLLFHGDMPLPMQAMSSLRLSQLLGNEYEQFMLGREKLWDRVVFVATIQDEYSIKRNTALGQGWVLTFPAAFEEEDLAPFLRRSTALMERG
jgi:hypothetical protein